MGNLFVDEPATREARAVQRTFELVAGVVLLLAALPALAIAAWGLLAVGWTVMREGSVPPDMNSTQATVLVAFLVIAIFFVQVGFRLVSHRPNVHGSLLSPGGWATLGFVFFGIGAALTIAIVKAGGALPIALDLSLLAFASICLVVARHVHRRSRVRTAN